MSLVAHYLHMSNFEIRIFFELRLTYGGNWEGNEQVAGST